MELIALRKNQYTLHGISQPLLFAARGADRPNEAEARGNEQAPWKPLRKHYYIVVWRSRGGDVELWFDNLASLPAEDIGVDQQELQSDNQQDNAGH